jgi:hypothetical protein
MMLSPQNLKNYISYKKNIKIPSFNGICNYCSIPMILSDDDIYVCPKCGINKHLKIDLNKNGATQNWIRIVGQNNNEYKDIMIKCYGKENSYLDPDSVCKQIALICDELILSGDISLKLIERAANLYISVINRKKCRSNCKKIMLAVCVHFSCSEFRIMISKKEICNLFKITKLEFSKGKNIVEDIIGKEIIEDKSDPIDSLILCYITKLNLPDCYNQYVKSILKIVDDKNLANKMFINGKIAGSILFLIQYNKNISIKKEKIEQTCEIKYSTMQKYINILNSHLNYFDNIIKLI